MTLSAIVYEPAGAIQLTLPRALGGSMILCSIRLQAGEGGRQAPAPRFRDCTSCSSFTAVQQDDVPAKQVAPGGF